MVHAERSHCSTRYCCSAFLCPEMRSTKQLAYIRLLTRAVGTSSERLKRGIRYFGCKPVECFCDNPDKLRRNLDALLTKGCPAILAVDNADHWAVIAGKASRDGILLDRLARTISSSAHWPWEKIVDWIDSEQFYMLGIVPRVERQLRHSIVPTFQQGCTSSCAMTICENIGDTIWRTCLKCFDCPENGADAFSAKEFFRLYGKMLLDACCYYYIDADEDKMRWELGNYRKVAIAHRLTVSRNKIPEAIANLSAALTAIACTE